MPPSTPPAPPPLPDDAELDAEPVKVAPAPPVAELEDVPPVPEPPPPLPDDVVPDEVALVPPVAGLEVEGAPPVAVVLEPAEAAVPLGVWLHAAATSVTPPQTL